MDRAAESRGSWGRWELGEGEKQHPPAGKRERILVLLPVALWDAADSIGLDHEATAMRSSPRTQQQPPGGLANNFERIAVLSP